MDAFKTTLTKAGKVRKADVATLHTLINKGVRRLKREDVDRFVLEVEKSWANGYSRIRVYSSDGFVAMSYKYAAPIDYVEAIIGAEKDVAFSSGRADAKRANGRGSATVVSHV